MIDYIFRSSEELRIKTNYIKESYNGCKVVFLLNAVYVTLDECVFFSGI